MVRSSTPEQALQAWAWQILSKLKLHLLDQPICHTRMALTDFRIAAQIPDINADTEVKLFPFFGIRKIFRCKSSICYVLEHAQPQ